MSEIYEQILKGTMEAIPEVIGILILDKDFNVIGHRVNKNLEKNLEKKLEPIANSTGVVYLSILKLLDHLKLNIIE
ncbi:hypothetical protein LCGC14_3098670 [marine sediment metagenome]|uniref:Uncharacterized protein n=1 Tax=marine sediment metagenome TaxID=412755 RepID=A0A0F8WX84_9ZZZZ